MLGKDYERQDCSLARALEVVGKRWTLLIIRDAFYGVRRFNDFQAHLDIPKAVLSDRLSGLVEEGILERKPDPDHAGRHLYRVFKHADCGTRLDDSGYCSRCELTPEPQDVLMVLRRGRSPVRDDPVAVALRAPRRLLEPVEI